MSARPDVACLAQNLARNCGYAVFPCGDDKRPLLKEWPQRAASDADAIAALWRHHPGPLIGIITGARSNLSVLDLDAKHDEACAWWMQHQHQIPTTRRFRTRSGGMHVYFRHQPGIGNTQGKIAPGVDTRGDGGYVIHWFAAGLPCLDGSPSAAWPRWLVALLNPPKPPAPRRDAPRGNDDAALDALTRTVREAAEGERNGKLFWAANRMRERGASRSAVETTLLGAAREAGLSDIEARRTIASAWRGVS
jgi:Bifunctional DNA primase/polymerase, N-terminal